jgi:hypothetical protein
MVSKRLGAPAAAGAPAVGEPAVGEPAVPVGAVVAQPDSAATESVAASSAELHLFINIFLTFQSNKTNMISNNDYSRIIPEASKPLLSNSVLAI